MPWSDCVCEHILCLFAPTKVVLWKMKVLFLIYWALGGPSGHWTQAHVGPATLRGLQRDQTLKRGQKDLEMHPCVLSILFRSLRLQKRSLYLFAEIIAQSHGLTDSRTHGNVPSNLPYKFFDLNYFALFDPTYLISFDNPNFHSTSDWAWKKLCMGLSWKNRLKTCILW